ncbi:uncharacterized protein [Argopecten irradians]|uniref:uncharacterized protein n=1 Tax=Argopecten irradians TaxID=31199 RepID=UPI00371AD229
MSDQDMTPLTAEEESKLIEQLLNSSPCSPDTPCDVSMNTSVVDIGTQVNIHKKCEQCDVYKEDLRRQYKTFLQIEMDEITETIKFLKTKNRLLRRALKCAH